MTTADRTRIDLYFTHIQPSIPLFRKPVFYKQYFAGDLPRGLLLAMVAASVRFSTKASTLLFFKMDLRHAGDALASEAYRDRSEWLHGTTTSLTHNIKKEIILVFHALASTPCLDIARRVGNLVRLGYAYGLHQVDSPTQCLLCSSSTTSSEKEELRFIWWCIFFLDSVCCMATGMPQSVERNNTRTALISSNAEQFTSGNIPDSNMFCLEPDVKKICLFAREMRNQSSSQPFNTSLLVSSFIQEIYSTHRLARESLDLSNIESHLITLRVSLASIKKSILTLPTTISPSTPTPPITLGCSQQSRIQLQLFLYLSDILLHLPIGLHHHHTKPGISIPYHDWDECRRSIEDFLGVIRQWNSLYFLSVSPFISFAVWTVSALLLLQEKVNPPPKSSLRGESVANAFALLDLFLMASSNHWWLGMTLSSKYILSLSFIVKSTLVVESDIYTDYLSSACHRLHQALRKGYRDSPGRSIPLKRSLPPGSNPISFASSLPYRNNTSALNSTHKWIPTRMRDCPFFYLPLRNCFSSAASNGGLGA